jgi:hypothetical protein
MHGTRTSRVLRIPVGWATCSELLQSPSHRRGDAHADQEK